MNENTGALTALASIAIAFFTLTLWLVTGDAVKLARDEFNATHRPHIKVLAFEVADGPPDPSKVEGVKKTSIDTFVRFVNAGDVDGTIVETGSKIIQHFELSIMFNKTTADYVMASGEEGMFLVTGAVNVYGDGFDALFGDKDPYYCVGYIHYRDSAGRFRKTGFCWKLDAESWSWQRVDDSPYSYSY